MITLQHGSEQLPVNIDDRSWYITHKYDGKDEMRFEMDSAHEMRQYLAEETVIRTMSDASRNCNQFLIKNIDEHSNFVVVDCDLDLSTWHDFHIHRIGSPVQEYEDAKLCYEEMAGLLGIAAVLEDALSDDIAASSAAGSDSVTLRGYTKTLMVSTKKSNTRLREAIADITTSAALANSLAQKNATTEATALTYADNLDAYCETLESYLSANYTVYQTASACVTALATIQSQIPIAQPSMLALRNHLQGLTTLTLAEALANVRPTGAGSAQWTIAVSASTTAKYPLLATNGNLLTNMTPGTLLDRIAEIWGLVVNYDVLHKIATVIDPAAAGDSGDLYMQDLNVSKIEYTGNSRDFVTIMYGYGKRDPDTGENLTFASVNQGLPYIENHTYSTKRVIGVYEDLSIDDATDLYNATYEKLLEKCNPVQNFDIKVNEIGAGAAMYKTAMVTMPTGVRVKHMIVEWKDYPDAVDLSTITLNKVAPSLSDEWRKLKHDDGILIEDINSDVTEDVEVGDRNNDDGILIAKDSEGEVYHRVDKDGVTTGDKSTDKDGNVQKGNTAGNHYTAVYNAAVNKEEMVIGDKENDLKADIDIYGDVNVEGSIVLNGVPLPGGGASGDYVEYVESTKTKSGTSYQSYKAQMGKGHASGAPYPGYHIDKRVEYLGFVSEELANYTSSDSAAWNTAQDHGLHMNVPLLVLGDKSSVGNYLYLGPTALRVEPGSNDSPDDDDYEPYQWMIRLDVNSSGAPRIVVTSPAGHRFKTDWMTAF